MSLPSLYEIAAEYRDAAERLADMDLPDNALADTLESLKFPVEVKATNVVMFSKSLDAVADAIEQEIARQKARAQAIRKRADALRDYTKRAMESCQITKIEAPEFALSIQANPMSVDVFDESMIPIEFVRQPEPPPPAPDKRAILAALKAGQDVPGCRPVRTTRLSIK